MPRFFADVQQQEEAFISGRDAHHILRSLRRKVGDELPIRDHDRGYLARITSVSSGVIGLEIIAEQELAERGSFKVYLGMSLIDLKDMDEMMRAVTELGVSEIHPLISGRSNVRDIGAKRLSRWRQIIVEAVKQCERRSIPVLHEPLALGDFLERTAPRWPCRLVASPGADVSLRDCRRQDAGIIIGPEGGFSSSELERIAAADFQPVSMGATILRAYTAALTAVSVLAM